MKSTFKPIKYNIKQALKQLNNPYKSIFKNKKHLGFCINEDIEMHMELKCEWIHNAFINVCVPARGWEINCQWHIQLSPHKLGLKKFKIKK